MAYDEALAQRVFMLRGNMFVGILGNSLMARVGPMNYERALASPGVREMDFSGRPMRGYVFVDAKHLTSVGDLKHWVGVCADFAATLPAKAKK